MVGIAADIVCELRGRGVGNVSVSDIDRAMYSSDASLFRVVPQVVVRARHVDELHAVHEVSRLLGVPLTMRGSGTSIAGNAVGAGIVVDTRAISRVLEVDPDARTAVVEPGVVHADLQRAAAPHGLRFGPDPSSHTRATIGGMIGNNACGSRALGYGRTVDNVEDLEVIWGSDAAPQEITGRLTALADQNLAVLRTQFGRFGRQVSGYSLEHLLPERRSIPRFLVGTEGTLATVTRATVRLVSAPATRVLVALGYPDMAHAADVVPQIRSAVAPHEGPELKLTALEGMDSRILDLVRSQGVIVPELPRGSGWLFAELGGDPGAVDAAALRVIRASDCLASRIVTATSEQDVLWRIREDGGGLAGRSLATPAYSGWEDSAVPPEHLGAWLREFEELLVAHGLQGIPYGHFGDGCIHVRIDFPFHAGAPASAGVFRDFMHAAAAALRKYGGTISGEHGDGRTRSELLPYMYDPAALSLFGEVKRICDPRGLMNPEVIADASGQGVADITHDLRAVRPRARPRTALRLLHDDGDLGAAVHRCTGVGKCVAPHPAGVMCPSYQATKNEKDSTRGRARVLQEALDGGLLRGGLADDAVTEALDLCLACKGCATDCPTGVDMAAYKSEALHQKHDVGGIRRPRTHITLGRLPFWARLAAPFAALANAGARIPPLAAFGKWVVGIDRRRSIPTFATRTLRGTDAASATDAGQPDVWIWADSFTDHFFPRSGVAALEYLRAHGVDARVIQDDACCGLTWITTGQLDRARPMVERTVERLAAYVDSGVPVLGLEPSCTATLRSDVLELIDSDRARRVAEGVLTFAELVGRLTLPVPDLTGVEVVAQPHCHQNAVLGWSADEDLLRGAGATVTRVDGCCGLAGNFGVEKGHYEVSVAVAETHLLPSLREHPDAVVLADGMSCRIQVGDLTGRPTMHLAELLASRR
ncbi:FAD-binding and (Fe-S)-binding domain-containing protein [uncultured Microbacterium sp.]|uniref:FAD-binding and (Fe-S)-binding domain-containing protein n=1 Tax=uncultured Microbacterium sp. TaxID=191216 RepID=UPI00262AE7F1|nr:FAD-binding and (Fe-S)-binding domain-containing protein [uncultured Microbacterium sp.]